MTEDFPIPNEDAQPVGAYSVFRLGSNDEMLGEPLARYFTEDDARRHRRRLDWRYTIFYREKRIAF